MSITTKLVTAEELAALGEDAPFELVRGELRRVSPTLGWHGLVTGRFAFEFGLYSATVLPGEIFTAEAGYFAEHDPDTVVAPDVFFIRKDRLPSEAELKSDYVRVPPDAVVEVRSPSNTKIQIEEKVLIYLRNGVRLVLAADPGPMTIRVRTPEGRDETLGIDDVLDGGDALPGFRVPVARFFRR
jgi:Uma2 family endonuclease